MGVDTILLLCGLLITIIAEIYIKVMYSKCKKVEVSSNMTGFDVARKILDDNGLSDIYVTETTGVLSDHYDPTRKVVKLSTDVFHGSTIASVSVAAHECGHAIQDKEGYTFMRIRSKLVPLVNFSSYAGYIAILIALFTGIFNLLVLGIALELIILLFQLITLPVEFDASKRGKKELKRISAVNSKEMGKSSSMLRAAAYTYVASVLTSILQILRLISLFSRRD